MATSNPSPKRNIKQLEAAIDRITLVQAILDRAVETSIQRGSEVAIPGDVADSMAASLRAVRNTLLRMDNWSWDQET